MDDKRPDEIFYNYLVLIKNNLIPTRITLILMGRYSKKLLPSNQSQIL
jgi:hypothetical protein